MKYKKEDVSGGLFQPGEYEAVVASAEDKISKKDNEMIEIRLTIYNGERMTSVYDYLMPSSFTFGSFLDAIGRPLPTDGSEQELTTEDCLGRNVRVSLKIEEQKGYADKNRVVMYMKSKGAPAAAARSDDFPEGDPFA